MKKQKRAWFGLSEAPKSAKLKETQYGYTATVGKLDLHAGRFMCSKRGGLEKAFMLDEPDYRFMNLLAHMGLSSSHVHGYVLGNLYDCDGGRIRFRITDEGPTEILVCYSAVKKLVDEVNTFGLPIVAAFSTDLKHYFAVYSLSRPGGTPYSGELNDNMFDCEPDPQDLKDFWFSPDGVSELDENEIARERLKKSGF